MLTRTEARDEITKLFVDEWVDGMSNALTPIIYDDLGEDEPDSSRDSDKNPKPWCRFMMRHSAGDQSSLGGPTGARRFTQTGTLFVQIFSPRGTGLSIADSLAITAIAAFRGKVTPGGATFSNVFGREVGPSGPWWQVNVSAAFAYDEVA